MSLRLVDSSPAGSRLTAADFRGRQWRAGDRREPLPFDENQDAGAFLDKAAAQGLAADTAITLGLERILVIESLERAGLNPDRTRSCLSSAAAVARVGVQKNSADARYLRQLCVARPVPSHAHHPATVAIPVRVMDRVQNLARPFQLEPEHIAEMVAWEIAA